MAELLEPETGAEPGQGVDTSAAAIAVALDSVRRRGRSGEGDEVHAFLRDQRRLIAKQLHHLDAQFRTIQLDHWSKRLRLTLQALTVLVGVLVLGAVLVMAWQAHEDHGVSIAAFSVSPDLAQRGLTGQVVASQLLDRLSDLQARTVTARPASTYANDWGGEIKVEIPETGVSIGELRRFLQDWLGSETRITGEIVRTSAGIAVTARSGAAPGRRFEGAEAGVDGLLARAAEAVYAQTQPYRYAVYLASNGQRAQASALFAHLAASGASEDRPWAYAGWSSILQQEGRHYEAIRMAAAAISLNPRIEPPYETLGVSSDVVGRWTVGLDNPDHELALVRGGQVPGLTSDQVPDRLRFLQAVKAFYRSDFRASAKLLSALVAFDLEGREAGYTPQHLRARALATMHDVAGAERLEAGPVDTNSYQAISGRGETLGDWAGTARRLEFVGRDPALGGDAKKAVVQPLLAQAYAHLGRLEEAKALAASTPLDCYRCLIARGEIATLQRDWAAADHWWALLARQTPSLAPARWAESLLARGDLDGASSKAIQAHRSTPHFADPLETWGEALMRKGDFAGAVAKFAEAAPYAPRWGHNHLLWGEALMLAGRYAEARAQYETASGLDLSRPDRAALNLLLARTASGPLHG